ncbi:hypothetical protein JAAARDRAFT_164138 [Jaapia argillacea MUCL 33604]|uniref:DNA-(apurinic or apyrimidinic site) endonuclease n=1 Tax=Jaapia argillacea MUCL 33604 TaxID=933084 RepID=A0A067PKS7_9AGAM|nr:hypothetical protein JAAARDRAFT_164138 [Jaapia argillacea MUCL 33604]
MRILSWNINGVRTLPQYHPWNTFKSFEGILEELKADIICFQEMKTSRSGIERTAAIPGVFDSFFSFPVNKGGYSGVAVYTDSRHVVPLKAEEGLSGKLQPKPPLTSEERVSSSYPYAHEMDLMADEDGNTPSNFIDLDSEGRALAVDFGLFVLINVYCPNQTSEARLSFKMNYHLLLQERVRKLVEQEKREVIVVGDMNICATPLDHCDGHLPSNSSNFWEHPTRAWFRDWIGPEGPMVDVVRKFWPERKDMYTCWNTKISARESNYGTRVDYILTTKGLLKWIKHGDIQPSIKGSDHCPIFIDLFDEITSESGETVVLQEVMKFGDGREVPRLAAKYWNEFSGKQKLLSSFFGKRSNVDPEVPPPIESMGAAVIPSPPGSTHTQTPNDLSNSSSPAPIPSSSSQPEPSQSLPEPPSQSKPLKPLKRKKSPDPTLHFTKGKKLKSGQTKLNTFFAKPKARTAPTPKNPVSNSHSHETSKTITIDDESTGEDSIPLSQVDADYRLACELSAMEDEGQGTILSQGELASASASSSSESKAAWSQLFARVEPPNCTIHGEPAKLFTVNKPGPNKGKTFFLCSRPVGPGYDKGKSERLREEVDHRYKCNYFKWASEVKRESLHKSSNGRGS